MSEKNAGPQDDLLFKEDFDDALNALSSEVAAADHVEQPAASTVETGDAGSTTEERAAEASPPTDLMDDARALIGLLSFGVEELFQPLKYTEETKSKAAQVISPLLVKYGVRDTLFGRWGDEFQAGMFFGGIIFASVKVYRAAKQADAEAQAAHKKSSWFSKLFVWSK